MPAPEQEQKVLASLYDRYDAVTYSPTGKSGAFPKQNIYFQMAKNTVLNPKDFAHMGSLENPSGDQRAFSAMVDALPSPGPLWADSGKKLSDVLANILGMANTDSVPSAEQKESTTRRMTS